MADRRDGIRVNLTVPREVVAVLDRMSKITGAGRATIVREWLCDMLPHLDGMARAMEMAAQKNIDAFKVVGEVLRDATAKAQQAQLDLKVHKRAAMRKRKRD